MLLDLLDNPMIFSALIAACGGLLAYALVYPLLSGEARAQKRMNTISVSQARTVRSGGGIDIGMRKKQVADTLKDIEKKQKANTRFSIEDRLVQAGLSITVRKFFLFCIAGAVFAGFIAFIIKKSILITLLATALGGVLIPFLVINHWRKKRTKKFVNEFPNAMDVIIRGVKSGLPLGDCLRIISVEAAEPIRSEFKHIVDIQQMGVGIGDACAELYRRVPVTESNFFGIVIQIQQKAGGNLGEILTGLSKVIRERRKMRGKIIAMSSEATASAGIIAALPFIVGTLVYLTSPQYIERLWTTDAGVHGLMYGAGLMTVGVLVMKKMINFDI